MNAEWIKIASEEFVQCVLTEKLRHHLLIPEGIQILLAKRVRDSVDICLINYILIGRSG